MSDATTYGSVSGLEPYAIWRGATARAIHGERLTDRGSVTCENPLR